MCCKFRVSNQNMIWIRYFGVVQNFVCKIGKIAMRIFAPVMFLFANLLILSVSLLMVVYILPNNDLAEGNMYYCHVMMATFLLTNIYFNYFSCAFTPPGAPNFCDDPGSVLGEKVSIIDGRKVYQISYQFQLAPAVFYKYCPHCKCIKPPRAHHDSITEKCVLNMDHYCPWMVNCVGFYNYRYFVLFLIYLCLGCSYVLFLLLQGIHKASPNERAYIAMSSQLQTNLLHTDSVTVTMYCFSVALSALISAGVLLIWHGYLCFTNQTTIEFYVNLDKHKEALYAGALYKNPFDEGWRKNLKRVFGDVPWYFHLCPNTTRPIDPKYPFDLKDRDLKIYNRV